MSKSKSNGFAAFCWDWKANKEKKGYHFADIKDVIANDECYDTWKNLSEDVKDYYRFLAKCPNLRSKISERRDERGRKNSSLESHLSYRISRRSSYSSNRSGHCSRLSSYRSAEPKLQVPPSNKKFKGTMEEYMALLMGSKKQFNCVQNLNFYIVHANYFYVREMDNGNSDYYPVELTVAECSLENGVQRVHHVMVKEEIFKGYRNDAVVRSQESHKIPIDFNWGKVEVKTDYTEIFQGICKFIEPGSIDSELPPLFTMRSADQYIWKPVKSILGRLALADLKHPDHLLLYSFEELFAYISNAVMRHEKSDFDIAQAIEKLEKDPNAHRSGFGCEFHRHLEEGELYCSSSFVKRWWYRLCDICCEPLGIEKIPGMHGPSESQLQTLVLTKLNLKQNFNSKSPKDQKRYFKYK